jgi:hypothetical protein
MDQRCELLTIGEPRIGMRTLASGVLQPKDGMDHLHHLVKWVSTSSVYHTRGCRRRLFHIPRQVYTANSALQIDTSVITMLTYDIFANSAISV